MKTSFQKLLALVLTLALLIPALHTAALSVVAATTSGTIGNMDEALVKDLIAPSEAPTVNLQNGGGIRFATNINLEKYADLKQFCKQRRIKGIVLGTVIAPLDYVLEAGEFSIEKLKELDHKTPYLDIRANNEIFYDGEKTVAQGYDEQFVASIMNIKLENRTRDFAAIGYIQLTLAGGNSFIIYSYDNQDMGLVEKYAANLADVASEALEQDCWNEEERAMIADLAAEEQTLSVASQTVKDVRIKRNQVYFTYVNKETSFYNRLTYDGANGWRLQTNTKSYNHFKDIGAGQALALYLDEGFHDITVPLTVTQKDGELVVEARGTDSTAKLTYSSFALDFCGEDGVSLYNVNGMSINKSGEVVLTGEMNATDAIYGGGERFDSTNNRGKSMSLYASDSYDTRGGNGTYVVVPLFSTSRGGGMFINRYERMTLNFPKKDTVGNWFLTINTEILDCYFYATGNIADVLQAYTDLTGHATLPEEWAQGYLVCRFQPDFTSLGGLTGEGDGVTWYYNIEDIPNYEKYSYTRQIKLTAENVKDLKHEEKIVSWDEKITYYVYFKEGSGEDLNGNGKKGESYFRSVDGSEIYKTYEELPNTEECYRSQKENAYLTLDARLPHKKAVVYGANRYHYVVEDDKQDFNYNGIYNETYFMRITSKSGQAGAGVTYIVESLIEAGMRPTAVILEGVTWYNMVKNAAQWGRLKKFVDYLDEQNIKTIVYTSLGHLTGADMASNYKKEYMLSVDIYEYDDVNGIGEKLKTTTGIPKSDLTDNPDTVSSGTQNYLDISNPEAVEWYLDTIWGEMMDMGIDGLKIDFSESLPNEGILRGMEIDGKVQTVYLKFNWYNPDLFEDGEPHHAYASYFVSVVNKAMNEKAAQREGDTGFVVLARGGGIGLQRNPYMLAGDQTRRFRNLETQLAAVISSGISGIPFVTYDMGGYAYHGTSYHYYGGQWQTLPERNGNLSLPDMQAAEEYESEIFIRGLQYTVFGNVIKTHGDVRHVYQMTQEVQDLSALYFALHDELMGYLRELSQIACDTGMPAVRHMILQYQNDANVADLENQFMFGDALLVAPILTCNTKKVDGKLLLDYASVATRTVYLPAGEWLDLNTGETIVSEGMTITVSANLAQIPVYLNMESPNAAELQEVFAGETWQSIVAYANLLDSAK